MRASPVAFEPGLGPARQVRPTANASRDLMRSALAMHRRTFDPMPADVLTSNCRLGAEYRDAGVESLQRTYSRDADRRPLDVDA